MEGPVRYHVFVYGRVQGVFFRDRTVEEAERRGVAGWVRNRRDGRVEAVFEGVPQRVRHAVDWCRRGPPAARVDDVAVQEEPPEGLSGFERRPTV